MRDARARSGADLARLRFGLHLVAGRREERLRFDHQKSLAALMGLQDEDGNLAVEQMMQGFFRAAAAMLRINDRLLQRFEEQLAGASAPVPVQPGFELRHGYLAMTDARDWPRGMDEMLELFAAWAAPGANCAACIRKPRGRWPSPCRPFAAYQDECRGGARALHRTAGRSPTRCAMLKRMARLGVLGR